MSNKAKKRLLKRIEELERQLKQFQKSQNKIPTYSFSRIQRDYLDQFVDIERKLGQDQFDFCKR